MCKGSLCGGYDGQDISKENTVPISRMYKCMGREEAHGRDIVQVGGVGAASHALLLVRYYYTTKLPNHCSIIIFACCTRTCASSTFNNFSLLISVLYWK